MKDNSKNSRLWFGATIAAAAVAAMGLIGCTSLTGGGAAAIDDDAAAVLKAMSDQLSSAQTFTFKATRTLDPALVAGRNVKTTATINGSVARPNKIAATSTDRNSTRRFYYDGTNVTLYDPKPNHYATVPGASDIDQTIDQIVSKWDFHPPMADLLVSDPFASLSKRATSGKLIGVETVRGVKCNRVAVTQDAVDFEAWISTSDHLPRRFIVTFNGIEGSPQYRAEIHSWDLNPKISNSRFNFSPPKGAQKIEMVPVGS